MSKLHVYIGSRLEDEQWRLRLGDGDIVICANINYNPLSLTNKGELVKMTTKSREIGLRIADGLMAESRD